MILGGCGAGKSTLANRLHSKTNIPVYHLDQHFWKSGWIESELDDWIQRTDEIIAKDSWIIDGNYRNTIQERVKRADTIIYLDRSTGTCLYRVLKRIIKTYGTVRGDMPEGCPEKFDWEFLKYVYHFNQHNRPELMQLLTQYKNDKEILIFENDNQVEAFINGL